MRIAARHALLFVALLVALTLAVDSATAAEAGTRVIDCWPSSGGAYEVCV